MSQNRNIENSRQNETGASQEHKVLRKRIPDHALLFTARAPIYTGMPPLISYVGQQSRGIGESNRQLDRQIMHRNSRASTMSRAMHLPVLSKVFDFIQRITAFFTPMHQRMLVLPWFQRRRKTGRSSIQTEGAIADRQRHTISLQPNGLYPNMILQTLHDTQKEQVGDEEDETYPKATEETYPVINIAPLSALLMRREPAISAHDFPLAVGPIAMPWYTRKIIAQYDQNVQTRPSNLTANEQPVSRANETPTVIKNVPLSLAAGMRLPDTDSETSHYARPTYMPLSNKQITHGLESEGGGEPILSHTGQSDTTVPAMHTPYEIRDPDHTQAKAVECRLTEVNRQTHHKYRTQTLSPVLMPITQRIHLHRKSIKAGSRIIGEGIRETKSSNIFYTGTSDEPIGQAVHVSRPLALSQQPATLEPKSVFRASSVWSGSAISGGTLKIPNPSKPPMIARSPSEMTSSTLVPEALTDRDGTRMLPGGISRQSVSQIGQARRQKPLVTSRVELRGDKADAIYQIERMIGDNQSKDTVNPGTPEHDRIGLGFARVHMNRPLFYRQPSSIAGSAQLSPDHESIHHAITLPTQRFSKSIYYTDLSTKTENYRFVPNRENISSCPDVKHAYQQAPELAPTSLLQEKAGLNTAYRKEVLTGTPDMFPELTYSRKQNVPELALTPINRIPEIQTQPAESEPQEAGSNERAAKGELESIARDVYYVLKRRLARERERSLGVI